MSVQVGPQWKMARAEQIRDAMGPEYCAVADALRATFGEVKQVWLETPSLSLGEEPEQVVPTSFRSERQWA